MNDCIFCKIINRELSSNILYEDEQAVAFPDIQQKAPTHILIVPKQHIESLRDITTEHEKLMGHLLWIASFLGAEQEIDESGYRVIINTGTDAGQEVFHIHVHLLGGKPLGRMIQP